MTWEEAIEKAFENYGGIGGGFLRTHYIIMNAAGKLLEAHYTQQITITVPAGCVVVVEEVKK